MKLKTPRWLGSALMILLVGCARTEPTIAVKGKVLVDGQPLTFGTIVFTPDAAKGNTSMHEPRGKLDATGVYEAKQSKDQPGMASGWYKVSISAQKMKDAKDPYSYASVIPNRYASPETSGLSVEVTAHAAAGTYDFALSSKER
jgi:hypothetical protein